MKDKFLTFNLILIMLLTCMFSFGCEKKEENNHNTDLTFEIPQKYEGVLKTKKIYVTSIGQSIDMDNLLVYFDLLKDDYGFTYTADRYLDASSVEDDSIVFIVVGCSIKALEEAGTTKTEEEKRADDFVKSAASNKFEIISLHLGGNARRGSTSDNLIDRVVKGSSLLIYLKAGNGDYYLSDTATKYNVPIYQIETMGSVSNPIKVMLGE